MMARRRCRFWFGWIDGMLRWFKESELSSSDILNVASTFHFSCIYMTECKQHCITDRHLCRSNENSASLSNRSSEHPLSPMPCPPPTSKVAKDRYQIFKLGDVCRDLSWQISQVILFRYSRPFCEASGFKHAPVWSVTWRQSLQIASLWRNEAVGRAGVKASARETSSQRAATVEHILICHCILSLWL